MVGFCPNPEDQPTMCTVLFLIEVRRQFWNFTGAQPLGFPAPHFRSGCDFLNLPQL
jgi:hypothetical protein